MFAIKVVIDQTMNQTDLPPCVARYSETMPDGVVLHACHSIEYTSRHKIIPASICLACKFRQATGEPPETIALARARFEGSVLPPEPKGGTGPVGPTGPVVLPPSVPRPDLAAIALTLPAVNPEKAAERTFKPPTFHPDGSIEYPRDKKDWEPPRDINGYVRDPGNKWLFHPLWVPCQLRHQTAFMKANCGCIDVIMRCNNPQAPEFGQRLPHEACAKCPVRKQ